MCMPFTSLKIKKKWGGSIGRHASGIKENIFCLGVRIACKVSQNRQQFLLKQQILKKKKKKKSQDEQQNHRKCALISKVNILPNRFLI